MVLQVTQLYPYTNIGKAKKKNYEYVINISPNWRDHKLEETHMSPQQAYAVRDHFQDILGPQFAKVGHYTREQGNKWVLQEVE